jgi:hypothetical protein
MRRRVAFALTTFTLVVASAPGAHAQAALGAKEVARFNESFASPDGQAAWAGPGLLKQAVTFGNAIELTAGAEGSGATIKASHVVNTGVGVWNLSLTASSPFDEDTSKGGFALDELTPGSSLKLQVSWSSLVIGKRAEQGPAQALCDSIAVAKALDKATTQEERRKARETKAEACDSQWIQENDATKLDTFDRYGFGPDAGVWTVSGFGKIGHASYEFLDTGAFAKKTETETPWSFGVTGSWQPLWKRRLYTVKYERQQGYEAQDEGTICPPTSGSACLTAPLGSPKHDDKDLVSFEVRQRFTDAIGLSVNVSYDLGSEDFGVEAPLYLIASDDYAGGVKVTYKRENQSAKADKDDWKFGVFVSKALRLY